MIRLFEAASELVVETLRAIKFAWKAHFHKDSLTLEDVKTICRDYDYCLVIYAGKVVKFVPATPGRQDYSLLAKSGAYNRGR